MDAQAAFAQLAPGEQQVWQSIYGAAAPFIWAQQSGMYQAPTASQQGFNALPYDQQATWYGTYGAAAPSVWQQQAAAAGGTAGAGNPVTGGAGAFNYGASLGNYPGTQYGTPWNNPMSIGAGTASVPYGYGVPGFGQAPIQIQPNYLEYLKTAPGYIPGSGTYNQWNLSQPGLVGTVAGVPNVNLRYGQGGTGDPSNGSAAQQTPDQWVQGGKLFNSTRTSNWGQGDQAGTGLDYIATTFLRPDTPSGINTSAWGAPDAYWQGLAQQIAAGQIQPTARGWELLGSKGYTPQKIGGAAPQQAASVGGGGAGGQGGDATQNALASIAASNAADQAARQAYAEWQMRTGDETLAMQKAQQAWSQTFSEHQQQFSEGVTEAGLLGTYNGQQTQAAQQQQWSQGFQQQQADRSTGLAVLAQQAALQGPRDWAKYWQMNASAPEGLRSALGSLAGQFNFAPGYQGTPGPATLQSRTQDLLQGGQLGAAAGAAAGGAGGTGGQPGQAANPWQFNLQNWSRMNPSLQQGVLGGLEAGGMYGPDVEAMLKAAAPRYTGPAAATVTA